MSTGASGPQFGERAEFGPDDICYRHSDRPSFTLCQRCGRTICGECQHNSAVGVLCSDCVRQTQPSGITQTRRKTRAISRRLTATDAPVVTYIITAICVVVYAAQLISANFGDNGVTAALWYAPLYSFPGEFEPWRMVTAMFTHSTGFIFHILFNLYALWLFGRNLERMMGRAAFTLLYIFSGLGGSLAVMLWAYVDPQTVLVPTVGASGAIFGVLAATLVAHRAARVNIRSLAVLIGLNFAIGLLPGAAISWQAHLGGMIIGAVSMWAILRTRGPRHKGARIAWLSLIAGVLVLLTASYFVVQPDLAQLAIFS